MSKLNASRNGCKDVFKAFLVKNAYYDGKLEIPVCASCNYIPNKLISFSKCLSTTDYDQWVHFYEDDCQFERVWNNPERYLPILKRFKGVIAPDFSVYRDFPLVLQAWNCYRNRAIAFWLQEHGINVIVNVRWADERSYDFCFSGISVGSTIAVGSYGNIKVKDDRFYFEQGFKRLVDITRPKTIISYGQLPLNLLEFCKERDINVVCFKPEFVVSRENL